MDQNFLALAVPAAMLVGYFLKQNPKVKNGSIPFINFALSFLGQLVMEVGVANAGVFDGALAKSIGQMLVQSALITVLSTGSHSTLKNSWQVLRDSFLAQAKERAAEAAMKAAAEAEAKKLAGQ